MTIRSFFFSSFFVAGSVAFGEVTVVRLNLGPATSAENTVDLEITADLTATDSSQISGHLDVRINFNPSDAAITSLELLSGELSFSAFRLKAGSGAQGYDLRASTLGGTVRTSRSPINVENGLAPASSQDVIINSGTLTGTVQGNEFQGFDFSETQLDSSSELGESIEISATLNNALSTSEIKTYDFDFLYPFNFSDPLPLGGGETADVIAEGKIRASGRKAFDLDATPASVFEDWAMRNGNVSATFDGFDFNKQIPNGLFWALGYNAGDEPSLLEPDGDGGFLLALPVSGTASEIVITSTETLGQNWFPVSNFNLSGSNNPIALGSTGLVRVQSTSSAKRFYRIEASIPNVSE